jgi:hypothetical protein
MGCYWCGGYEPRFPDEMAIGYTKHVNGCGGVVTWDVPVGKEGKRNGLLPEAFMPQLKALGEAVSSP